MAESKLDRLVRGQDWLDPVAKFLQSVVGGTYGALGRPGRWLKSAMHGSYLLGHALHPVLTDVPVGAWTVGLVLDIVAHFRPGVPHVAGDLAVAIGLIAAVGTVVTGYTDFHETYGQERRVAVTHGLMMTTVFILYLVSVLLRWKGGIEVHRLAFYVSAVGYALLVAGSYLGGHLVFQRGTMINRNAFADGPTDYVPVGASHDFDADAMKVVDGAGMPVLVARQPGRLCAIGDTCSHAGGPLHEGSLKAGVVTCPWHGSRFRVADGGVVEGPATFDQPTLRTREANGRVEVKLEHPLHD